MARTANASLIGRLKSEFDEDVRAYGMGYARNGKVSIIRGDANEVVARVRDSQWNDVRLTRDKQDHESLLVTCSCKAIRSDMEQCPHVWATIVLASEHNYLRGATGYLPRFVDLDDSLYNDEVDESYYEDWDDDSDDKPRTIPIRSRAEPSGPEERRTSPPVPQPPVVPPWRRQLSQVRASVVRSAEPCNRSERWPQGRELLYVIDTAATLQSSTLVLELLQRDRKMNGEWSKPKSRGMTTRDLDQLPDPLDRQITSMLIGAREHAYYGYGYSYSAPVRYALPHAISVAIMELACQTGRCMVRSQAGEIGTEPLVWDGDGSWEFCLTVRRDPSSRRYELTASVCRGDERMPIARPIQFLLDELIFVGNRVARLRHFGALGWYRFFASAGTITVPEEDGGDLVTELLSVPKLPKLDLPDELKFEEVSPSPRPCLKVRSPSRDVWGSKNLLGTLSFDYDGTIIANDDPRNLIVQAERRRMMRRDTAAEAAAYGRLREVGFKPASYWTRDEASLELVPKRLPRAVSELLAAGWHVEAEGKLYRRPGRISIEVSSGIDWFELNGSVDYGDTKASLPALLVALKKGDTTVLLDDGTFGMVPEEWLKKYGVLAGLGRADGNALRFTRSQVGLLDALLAAQPEATCDEVFSRARDELARFQGIRPQDASAGFVGKLRPYQQDGLGWMQFLQQFRFGGCLADDMGLGKTVQVLALLESRRALRERTAPSLVVVPKSLVFNWTQEAARFAPRLRVLDHTGAGRTKGTGHFNEYDVVLTTYGTLRRDSIELKDAVFDYVILDEAQAVKNSNTESAKVVRLLRGAHRLVLSGTPIENHLGELWSLFDFLNPGMLGAASVLRLGGAGARSPDPSTCELLARALRPFILRRTKEQVAKDLPPKVEQTIFCELESAQRKLYNELRDHYRNSLLGLVDRKGINKSKIQVFEALLRLRQAACHPGLIDKSRSGEPCAKLDVLLPQLDEVIDGGHKVLVFSQFTSMLAIVRQLLDAQQVRYVYLDGKTRDRKSPVEKFQTDPRYKLFLVSLKAGGLGLNLTAAEYVFLLDPWWNPAVESQAIDRAHRIGQSRQVFAYRLIARDTVEEKVLMLQNTKRDLADAIINADNSLIRKLSRNDLELLLS